MDMFDHVKKMIDDGDLLLEWDYANGDPPKPMLKDEFASERRKAKTLNFSIAYGKTAHGLSQDWGVSIEEAEKMLSGKLDEEFLPTALRVAEYDHFIEQISLVANEPRYKRDAEDSAEESKEDETCAGVWKLDGKASNLTRLDDYLSAVGVPFVFKGLAKGCLFTQKGLMIIFDERKNTATIVADATTGRRKDVFVCDDGVHKVRNGWGNEVAMQASILPGGCLMIVNVAPPSLPARSTVT